MSLRGPQTHGTACPLLILWLLFNYFLCLSLVFPLPLNWPTLTGRPLAVGLCEMYVCVCVSRWVILTLCDPVDYSPPGFPVHEIPQARVLEWVAISFSRGSSQPRDRTQVSCIAGGFFTIWAAREAMWMPPACRDLQPRGGNRRVNRQSAARLRRWYHSMDGWGPQTQAWESQQASREEAHRLWFVL